VSECLHEYVLEEGRLYEEASFLS